MAQANPDHTYDEIHSMEGCLAVAAVDFGTACSGYSFCLTGDEDNVIVNKNWGKAVGMTSLKTATSVLTELKNGRHTFLKFGLEAEQSYSAMLAGEERDNVCLYNKFKMKLHTDSKSDPMTHVLDKRGVHQVESIHIFSMALKYMKDHLLECLNESGKNISSSYIRWVLTVPAIWSVRAKSFMRKAAFHAGLIKTEDSNHLMFALEPEAASMFCKSLRMNDFEGEKYPGDLYMPPETVYAIVDAGGGTVDITVHEVLTDGNVKEVCAATGGAWGGTSIDKAFVELLKRLWGAEFVNQIQSDFPTIWWEIESHFERVKRMCNPGMSSDFNLITINFKMAQRYQEITGKDITDVEGYGLSVNADYQLVATKAAIDGLFLPTVQHIVDKLEELVETPECEKMNYMFLVGGLNCSRYMTDGIRSKFGKLLKILIPEDPELAVLKGAIKFGQNPGHITSRVVQRTYGISTYSNFDPTVHPNSRKKVIEGNEYCRDVFSTLVTKGQNVRDGEEICKTHFPISSKATAVHFEIYSTDKLSVEYSDDRGVETTGGFIDLPMPDLTGGTDRPIDFRVAFGKTEIEARARQKDREESQWKHTTVQYAGN